MTQPASAAARFPVFRYAFAPDSGPKSIAQTARSDVPVSKSCSLPPREVPVILLLTLAQPTSPVRTRAGTIIRNAHGAIRDMNMLGALLTQPNSTGPDPGGSTRSTPAPRPARAPWLRQWPAPSWR